jgi:hypothetical protein
MFWNWLIILFPFIFICSWDFRDSSFGTDGNQLDGWFLQENAALDRSMMDLTDDVKSWTMVEATDLIFQTTVPLKACATKSRHVGANFKKFRKVSYPPCTWKSYRQGSVRLHVVPPLSE